MSGYAKGEVESGILIISLVIIIMIIGLALSLKRKEDIKGLKSRFLSLYPQKREFIENLLSEIKDEKIQIKILKTLIEERKKQNFKFYYPEKEGFGITIDEMIELGTVPSGITIQGPLNFVNKAFHPWKTDDDRPEWEDRHSPVSHKIWNKD